MLHCPPGATRATPLTRLLCFIRSMAWVTYATEKAAEKAIAMNGQDFGGRDVQAQAATREKDAPKKERAPRGE